MQTLRALLLASAALVVGTAAGAQTSTGTLAGTVVSNTAQASFTVNGTAQTASSNASTFVVDRKVNLTVTTAQAGATQVNLGQTGAVTAFRVTNNTNGTQDFLLAATQVVPAGILTGTSNFTLANLKIYVDANNKGVYDPGVDTAAWIDELAPDASATVFVVGDVPGQQNADRSFVGLDVTVAAGGAAGTQGTALVPTDLNVADQANSVDVVFADDDNDGTLGLDTARNGQGWAYAAYQVGAHSVNLSVVKTATVVSDGVSVANPKALPGAVIQYCLTVANATPLTPANNVTLTDVIAANTSYVPGSITVGGPGTAGVCLVNGSPVADNGSTTTPYSGSYNASTKTVTATIPTLAGGASLAASFRVTVN
jgi:uncharacterized repeat protein (TIGR01451 family)